MGNVLRELLCDKKENDTYQLYEEYKLYRYNSVVRSASTAKTVTYNCIDFLRFLLCYILLYLKGLGII